MAGRDNNETMILRFLFLATSTIIIERKKTNGDVHSINKKSTSKGLVGYIFLNYEEQRKSSLRRHYRD